MSSKSLSQAPVWPFPVSLSATPPTKTLTNRTTATVVNLLSDTQALENARANLEKTRKEQAGLTGVIGKASNKSRLRDLKVRENRLLRDIWLLECRLIRESLITFFTTQKAIMGTELSSGGGLRGALGRVLEGHKRFSELLATSGMKEGELRHMQVLKRVFPEVSSANDFLLALGATRKEIHNWEEQIYRRSVQSIASGEYRGIRFQGLAVTYVPKPNRE